MKPGCLFIVATPIGNLQDITLRALETLKSVDQVAAEDTRRARRLLSEFGITVQTSAYHEHNEARQTPVLIRQLKEGRNLALISDAGTPLISDPGYRLVIAAVGAGIRCIPIPGPCAAIAALSVSGLATDRFFFEGFLPARNKARLARLQALAGVGVSLVVYESAHRILDCLKDVQMVYGADHPVSVSRELTKKFETVLRGAVADVLASMERDKDQQRGEFVIVLDAVKPASPGSGVSPAAQKTFQILCDELPASQAARITARLTGESRKAIYDLNKT